jgi:hypothetical protein
MSLAVAEIVTASVKKTDAVKAVPLPPPTTFGEAKKRGITDLDKKLQEAIYYFELLAQQSATDINSWPIAMLDGVSLEKKSLNQVFFKQPAQPASVKPVAIDPKSVDAMAEKFRKRLETNRKNEIKNIQYYIDDHLRNAESHSRNLNACLTSAANQRAKLDLYTNLDGAVEKIKAELVAIVNDPFWEYLPAEPRMFGSPDDELVFANRQDIILLEQDPDNKIDRRLNVGRFKVYYSVTSRFIRVMPFERNVKNKGNGNYYHPYVSSGGEPCWGTASGTAGELMLSMQLGKVMQLLATLLSTYSTSSNPYVRLVDFPICAKPGEAPLELCERCQYEPERCECRECAACGVEYHPDTGCGGNICGQCGECAGPDDYCLNHYCHACDNYSRRVRSLNSGLTEVYCRNGCRPERISREGNADWLAREHDEEFEESDS